jgi:hypothetical protein
MPHADSRVLAVELCCTERFDPHPNSVVTLLGGCRYDTPYREREDRTLDECLGMRIESMKRAV